MIKTFVLDTNVLVHNPQAIFSFAENKVVIPIAVLEELDNFKKSQDERGRSARQFSRMMDDMRSLGKLSDGLPLAGGGSLKVELSVSGPKLPEGLDTGKVDNTILRVALWLKQQGEEVRFISKDINARIKAVALGLEAEDYEKNKINIDELYTGWVECMVGREVIDGFYKDKRLKGAAQFFDPAPLTNQFVLLRNREAPNQSALGKAAANGE